MTINNKTISNWVRQARYRAKKHNSINDLTIEDIETIIEQSNDKCAYCADEAATFDFPFPISKNGPNIPANVVLCCKKCKSVKRNNDIIWMYINKKISERSYLNVISCMCNRRCGEILRKHVQRATGLGQA